MKKFFSIPVTAFVVAVLFICSSWGYLVHRTINQLAIYQLPGSLRTFFYINKDSIARNAPRPDMRRSADPLEGSRHFIDLEAYGDSAAWKMPVNWEEAVLKYGRDSLLKYGYVPYQILFIQKKLIAAFQSANRDSIIYYATDLGHYTADAHVPLHTALNYDGQFSNQRGIHDLWETTVPEAALESYRLHDHHRATYLPHPDQAIWETIRASHALLMEMFAVEKDLSKQFTDSTKYVTRFRWGKDRRFYSPAFAKLYNERLGASINNQLLRSADQLADFWYTSWVDAGRPDLTPLFNQPVDRKLRKQLKKERRAYRRGQLIEKKLLIARDELPN